VEDHFAIAWNNEVEMTQQAQGLERPARLTDGLAAQPLCLD
jgi:hypothetical protein